MVEGGGLRIGSFLANANPPYTFLALQMPTSIRALLFALQMPTSIRALLFALRMPTSIRALLFALRMPTSICAICSPS